MTPAFPQGADTAPDVIEQQDRAVQAEQQAGQKYTKAEANYRPAGKSPSRCVFCANYQPGYPSTCKVVEGPIQAGGVSDFYKPANKPDSSPQNPAAGESITDLVGPGGA